MGTCIFSSSEYNSTLPMLYNYLVLPNNIIFMTICLENCNKYVAGIKVNVDSKAESGQLNLAHNIVTNASLQHPIRRTSHC